MHKKQSIFFDVSKMLIKHLRLKHGLNQKQMGDIIGVNQSQYSKYERGKQTFNSCHLSQYAAWFEVDFDDMIKEFKKLE